MDYVLFLLSLIVVLLTLILATTLWGKNAVLSVFVGGYNVFMGGYKRLRESIKKYWKTMLGVLIAVPLVLFSIIYLLAEHQRSAVHALGGVLFLVIYLLLKKGWAFFQSKRARLPQKKTPDV